MSFPAALSQEVLRPDHVVAVAEDDGSYRLLLYSGRLGAGFVFLKDVTLAPEHAAGLIVGAEQVETVDAVVLEDSLEQMPAVEPSVCRCGAPLMPSGWCTAGHAP